MKYEDLTIRDSFYLGEDVEIVLAYAKSKKNYDFLGCFLVYNDILFLLGFDKDYYCLRNRFVKNKL